MVSPVGIPRFGQRKKRAGYTPDATIMAFSPRLWLDATSLSATDGAALATVNDVSGNANDAAQATPANRPTYKANAAGTLPAIQFVAASQQYFNLPSLASLTAGTVFIVVKRVADPEPDAASAMWIMGTAGSATHFPFEDGNIYDSCGSTTRQTVGNPTPTLAAWNVYAVRSGTNDWEALLNGTSLFSTATNTVGFPASPTLGFDNRGGARYFDGWFGEFVVIPSLLSVANCTTIKDRLKAKWGTP